MSKAHQESYTREKLEELQRYVEGFAKQLEHRVKEIDARGSCEHEVVSVTENPWTRHGVQTSYAYCLKCGRKAMDIERNCKHSETDFGKCRWCETRLSKHDCTHTWTQEPDTDEYWCINCGEWQDEVTDMQPSDPDTTTEQDKASSHAN